MKASRLKRSSGYVIDVLRKRASPSRAASSAWFFKTGKGQYGYGDKFIGVTVPEQRKVAKKFADLPLSEVDKLLKSEIHECRLTALFILVGHFNRAGAGQIPRSDTHKNPSRKLTDFYGVCAGNRNTQDEIVRFYLTHTKYINNWDLVDSSASYILGTYLIGRPVAERKILYKLAKSANIWERRIAIIASGAFIREGQFEDTLKLATLLLTDTHDLIHKAVGWMLCEVGKRSKETLVRFLIKNASNMPRTALRYSLEHFNRSERRRFMSQICLV